MPELRLILSVGRPVGTVASVGGGLIPLVLVVDHGHNAAYLQFVTGNPLAVRGAPDYGRAHVIARLRDPREQYNKLDRPRYRLSRKRYDHLLMPQY